MMSFSRSLLALLGIALLALGTPDGAFAYGGPGSVISGIGALLAAVVAVLASLLGFVWFPLKRLYQKMSGDDAEAAPATADSSDEAPSSG